MIKNYLNPVPRPGASENSFPIGVIMTAAVLFFIAAGCVTYLNTSSLLRDARLTTRTHDVLVALGDVQALIKDAESSQRAYLITGDSRYIDPYQASLNRLDQRLADLERVAVDNPAHRVHLPALKENIALRRQQLAAVVGARQSEGFEQARAIISTDRGRPAMEQIVSRVQAMEQAEKELRAKRLAKLEGAYRTAVVSGVFTALLGIVLAGVIGSIQQRSNKVKEREEWLRSAKLALSTALTGEQRLSDTGEAALRILCEHTNALAGVCFADDEGLFRKVSTYGVDAENGVPDRFTLGDGLLGQAAKERRVFEVREVPDGYLTIRSALGRGNPRHLVISPISIENNVVGVLGLGFLDPVSEVVTELLRQASDIVGIAIRAAKSRAHIEKLLEETQRQTEQLQVQGEELRVTNEELEEQGKVLRESQGRLEQQQAELEQINAHLEEQTSLLETERDEVTKAKAALQVRTQELDRASRYKSEFLANMSHELRTPLNSSLILARLLADNASKNLSEEQVRYAQTIESAGNDLLNLINDVLDLSKIEAGRMEVRPEPISLPQVIDVLLRFFQPVAEQKGLSFSARLERGCPETLESDRQRLEQILKNLLANALKFTEQGGVELVVAPAPNGGIAFSVSDTGIGIELDQQATVFEAFRQADGTTNRKFGGTGLGLSISRELARLLGGEITLTSEPGRGSTFVVTLPETLPPYQEKHLPEGRSAPDFVSPARITPAPMAAKSSRITDDRERLTGNRRVILVVEDDPSFARIMYDLARELGFQCLIAATAEEGLAMAIQFRPSAVLLDVGLPDHSGLSVLDRLKRDARTRHIPVHVISASDYSKTALSLGAVGYMLKPVNREQLADALARLETRLEQRLRRILVVEDDPVQLESIRALLGTQDVEVVGARSAAECLERLQSYTFDCMVLDFSLPDATGHSLLETLSQEDAYSFPPVIVYTGRALSGEEEQCLRRYSKSIIIKGAKSPERLLDEVTLFLHQVVSELPPDRQRMLETARSRDTTLEGRRILVAEDDVRNVFAITSILEPRGATVQIVRNGREAIEALERAPTGSPDAIDLVLMDIMMPEMDGITAIREIRRRDSWKKLPMIALTAKAMRDDQEQCLAAGANDYMSKPLDVEKLLSLVRVWMPR